MSNQPFYTQPPPERPRTVPRRIRWTIGISATIFVLFILARVASTVLAPVPAAGAIATSTVTTALATPAPSPQTLSFSGNGNKQMAFFSAPENWTVAYTCYGFTDGSGMAGEMSVSVYGPGAALIAANVIDATCAIKGTSDSTEMHRGGRVYLGIIATGAWRLTVRTHP